jgi:RNA polymerase-binding transcription factor DksA
MTKKERDHLEQRLLRERERALKALQKFDDRTRNEGAQGDGDLTTYPLHLADEGTDTMEQEKEFLLATKEGSLLYAIDEALRTLYRHPDRYGVCSNCSSEISFERLDIVPWAQYCVECQREQEQRVVVPETSLDAA